MRKRNTWMKALLPLAFATAAFGQTDAPESAEHAYARQQYEGAVELNHERQAAFDHYQAEKTAAAEALMKDCNTPRPAEYITLPNGKQVLIPRRRKTETLHEYYIRRSACNAPVVEETMGALPVDSVSLKLLKLKLEYADACAAVYQKTIDERAADITTRESELIKTCRSADLYPPHK